MGYKQEPTLLIRIYRLDVFELFCIVVDYRLEFLENGCRVNAALSFFGFVMSKCPASTVERYDKTAMIRFVNFFQIKIKKTIDTLG